MRQEAYRVAFDEANWELKEIVGQFDNLNSRKDQIEKVVEVLKPFVGFGGQNAGTDQRAGDTSTEGYQQRGFGSGASRGVRLEAYRVAFDEASTELKEFMLKFEQLRYRKEHLERVVDVLKPLVGSTSVAVMEPKSGEAEAAVAEPAAAAPSEPAAAATEEPTDPFQRRLDSAIGSGGNKDLRDYSRLFSSLQRR